MLCLAAVLATAHTIHGGDHPGDHVLCCLAVIGGSVAAIGIAAPPKWRRTGAYLTRLPGLKPLSLLPIRDFEPRAGPLSLQVLRL